MALRPIEGLVAEGARITALVAIRALSTEVSEAGARRIGGEIGYALRVVWMAGQVTHIPGVAVRGGAAEGGELADEGGANRCTSRLFGWRGSREIGGCLCG